MTHRSIRRWLTAAAVATLVVPAALVAQAPRGSAELLKSLAAKPTPHLNGKPDFNGTWDHLGGIEFVRPEKLADGSICLRGCAPATPRPAPAAGAAPRPA